MPANWIFRGHKKSGNPLRAKALVELTLARSYSLFKMS